MSRDLGLTENKRGWFAVNFIYMKKKKSYVVVFHKLKL